MPFQFLVQLNPIGAPFHSGRITLAGRVRAFTVRMMNAALGTIAAAGRAEIDAD
ncbi:MAG: hypothetical protein RIK87_04235 [Fuerstiella sp.]